MKGFRIITSGKGGAGKTTVTSALVYRLATTLPNQRIFVLDADPSETLSLAIGIEERPSMGIGALKDFLPTLADEGKDEDLTEKEVQSKTAFVLKQLKERCIVRKEYPNHTAIDFAYMGHHQENSCMCAYNSAVNNALFSIINSGLYDWVIMDRDAGLEHINRSVYGGENDILLLLTWPSPDYISVAETINELADSLGSTKKRILVVNDVLDEGIDLNETDELLAKSPLAYLPRVVFPKIPGRMRKSTMDVLMDRNPFIIDAVDYIVKKINDFAPKV